MRPEIPHSGASSAGHWLVTVARRSRREWFHKASASMEGSDLYFRRAGWVRPKWHPSLPIAMASMHIIKLFYLKFLDLGKDSRAP